MNAIERAIPKQLKGFQKHFTASRKFIAVTDAQLCYGHAIARLLNVNHWHDMTMLEKGAVQLTSASGKQLRRKARLNDYIRFGLPAPDNEAGKGFDWVQVINIQFSTGRRKEQCLLSLQPCAMPGGSTTAHFFTSESSSNFLITRDGKMVSAEYYGQNELPNTATTGLKAKVRNVAVAAAAILGFSASMWQPMMGALLMDGTQLRGQKA